MATTGKLPVPSIDKYLPHPGEPACNFREWYKMFQRFLVAVNDNQPTEAKLTGGQKNNYLYMLLGQEGARIFNANPMAEKIDTANHSEFSAAVVKQFQPIVNQATACFDFYRRDQLASESTDEYLTALRTMMSDCKFEETTETQLAIRLICGCNNRDTQVKLLAMEDVKLNKVVAIMQAEERARANADAMSRSKQSSVAAVTQPRFSRPPMQNRRQNQRPTQAGTSRGGNECTRCGRKDHDYQSASCPALNVNCNFCNAKGHFERFCHKKKPQNQQRQQNQPRTWNKPTGRASAVMTDDDAVLRRVQANAQGKMVKVVEVSNGQNFRKVEMEMDTAAGPSTIKESIYRKAFSDMPLLKPRMTLYNYDETPITKVIGCFETRVRVDAKAHQDYIHVVEEPCTNLLGRNFIKICFRYLFNKFESGGDGLKTL